MTKLEKRVITECLTLYKAFPCLWDNRQVGYSDKEARDQAYEVLLDKYRQLQEDATVIDLKKRIENMRSCYRREYKKVLLSRINGDEYSPQLWYFEQLTFLSDVMDFTKLERHIRENSNQSVKFEYNEEDTSSSLKQLLENSQSRVKKRKIISYEQSQHDSDGEEVVIQDDVEEIDIDYNNSHHLQNESTTIVNTVSESESFGTTVGLQLKELDPLQKVYAEKLISDVIYNARLNRLTFNSTLNIYE